MFLLCRTVRDKRVCVRNSQNNKILTKLVPRLGIKSFLKTAYCNGATNVSYKLPHRLSYGQNKLAKTGEPRDVTSCSSWKLEKFLSSVWRTGCSCFKAAIFSRPCPQPPVFTSSRISIATRVIGYFSHEAAFQICGTMHGHNVTHSRVDSIHVTMEHASNSPTPVCSVKFRDRFSSREQCNSY